MATTRLFLLQDLEGFTFRAPEEVEARRASFTGCAEVVSTEWQTGTEVRTALDPQGRPFLFFGRSIKHESPGTAYVWMLGHATRLYENRVGLIRGLRRTLKDWETDTPLMYTYMNPESADHIRILRASGFVGLSWIAYNGDQSTPYIEMVRLAHGH